MSKTKGTRILHVSLDFKPGIMDLIRMIRDRLRGGHGMFVAHVHVNEETGDVDGVHCGYALGPFVGLSPVRVLAVGEEVESFHIRSLKPGDGIVSQTREEREEEW